MAMTWQVLLLLVRQQIQNPKSSEYVAYYYDSNWMAGLVQNKNCDEKDFEMNFLHPPGPSNSFTWPKRKNVCWVPYMNVICKIGPPTISTGQTLSRGGR